MPTTVLTPVEKGTARPVGASLWRKRLLPIGDINYEGRTISFTRDYLSRLVKAFKDKAYDAVPFQFADADNKHTNAVERRRGTVRDLELTADGLDIIVEAGQEAQQYLREYPDLGISASIVEGYERADRKFFPAAIKHVLGTLDPRLTGLGEWQAVEAASPAGLWQFVEFTAEDGEVLDCTTLSFATPGAEAPDAPQAPAQTVTDPTPAASQAQGTEEPDMALTDAQQARLDKLFGLPDDQFDALITPAAAEEVEDADTELTDEEIQTLLDSVPDAEPEAEPEAAEPELVEAGAAQFTAEQQAVVELANARVAELERNQSRLVADLARGAYERERDTYVRQGIPLRFVDLARPLLEGEGRTVDLSNGKSADAGAIVRKLLAEFASMTKELGIGVELGNPGDGSDEIERAAQDKVREDREATKAAVRAMIGA